MPNDGLATLYLFGNSKELIEALKKYFTKPNLKVLTKKPSSFDYQVYLLDLSQTKDKGLNELIDEIFSVATSKTKTALVIIGNSFDPKQDTEYYRHLIQVRLSASSANIRLLQTLDLYHEDSPRPISPFEKFIYSAVKTNKIAVSGNGDRPLYLTALPDLAKAIIKSLFLKNTETKMFTIIGEVITDLEFAYLLKRALEKNRSTLDIDINGKSKESIDHFYDLSVQSQAALNWLPETSVSDSLAKIVKNFDPQAPQGNLEISEPKEPSLQPLPPQPEIKSSSTFFMSLRQKLSRLRRKKQKSVTSDLHATEKRGITKIITLSFISVFIILAVPVLSTVIGLSFTARGTYQAFQTLRRGDSSKAQTQLNSARKIAKFTSLSFHYLVPPGNLLLPQTTKNVNNFLLLLDHGQIVLDSAIKTFDLSKHLYLSLLGQETLESDQIGEAIKVNLLSLNDNLSQIQLLLKDAHPPINLNHYLDDSDLNSQINTLKEQISNSLPLLEILDHLLLDQGTKHFVILVQDNNELRASGGFLNTVVSLTLEKNHLTEIQAEPSLSIDRLVEGNIIPPPPVKQLLNQASWTFRDSNVDADFRLTGKNISWFIERFKNTHIDGLITLDLDFYKKLLAEFGPITLATGAKIDQGNLASLASNPTLDSNSDVITLVSKAIITKITNGELGLVPLARALLDMVSKNEVNLYFPDQTLEALAEKSSLSGAVVKIPCHPQLSSSCQSDTVYLNESNFSVAKTNYYLKRSQNHLVEIDNNGQIKITLNYTYSFPVPAPISLREAYKVYYQFYLPAGSTNLTVSLDNQNLDTSALILTTKESLDKLEFSSSLALNQNHQLKISFISPTHLNLKLPQAAYSLSFAKQAGTTADQFNYTLHYPDIFNPKILTLPMKTSTNHELSYQTDSPGNLSFGILFKNISL